MSYKLRYTQRHEIFAAIQDLERWGYPRQVSVEEVTGGAWLVAEKAAARCGWVWLHWIAAGTAAVHVAAHPAHRGRIATRHVLESIRWAGELMGARRVAAVVGKGTRVADYCRRLGWRECDGGFFIEVRQ